MNTHKAKLSLLVCVVLGIYTAIYLATAIITDLRRKETVSLDEGWTITTSDAVIENARFSTSIRATGRRPVGDVVVFERVLEDMGSPAFPTILLRTDRSAVQIYLDEELIYEGQMERVENREFVGRRIRLITLPDDYAGKTFKMICYVSNTGPVHGDEAPRFGGYEACHAYFMQHMTPAIAAADGVLIFGVVFLFISLFFITSTPGHKGEVVSSLTAIVTGIWMFNFFDISRIYLTDEHATAIEFTALYMMLPMLYLWLGHMYERVRRLRRAAYCGIAIIVMMVVLHALKIVPIISWIIPYLMISGTSFVTMLVMMTKRRRRSGGENDLNVQETGVMVLIASMLLYLIVYAMQNFGVLPDNVVSMYIPVAGFSCFMVSLIIYYFIHVSETYARRKEFSALSHLAYVDVLTGLPNRKAAMNVFARLEATEADYAILSLDMNGLKTVNDRYGHHEGDRLLQTAAEVLNECFSDIGFRARLAGDEFLVVIRHAEKHVVEERLKRMHERFAFLTRSGRIHYSISCGVAYATEVQGNHADQVYQLADQRMYVEKENYYQKAD